MKKGLLSLAVLGTLVLSACEKQEFVPAEQAKIQADKTIMCRGCADWDIVKPEPEASSSRVAAQSTDTTAAPAKPVKPGKGKK